MSMSKQAIDAAVRKCTSIEIDTICDALGGVSSIIEVLCRRERNAAAEKLLRESTCILACCTCRVVFLKVQEFLMHKLTCSPISERVGTQFMSQERVTGNNERALKRGLEGSGLDMSVDQSTKRQAPIRRRKDGIRILVAPLLFRSEGIIATQDVVKTTSDGREIVNRLKSWDFGQKDTAVIGDNGQIIVTGTSEEMKRFVLGEPINQVATDLCHPAFMMCCACKRRRVEQGINGGFIQ